MKSSITQESDFGCGVACFAFVTGITYEQAVEFLGEAQAKSNRFWAKDFVAELNRFGLSYISKYIKPHIRKSIYQEDSIVLIRRSKIYPAGHYLVRHNGQWMDPWINLPGDKNIRNARSGYRKRLPGKPMYVLSPVV